MRRRRAAGREFQPQDPEDPAIGVSPFKEGRLIAAGIPGARFVELDSDNHVILQGELAWDRYMREIEAFLPA